MQILVGINHISGTGEAIVVKFCMYVDYVKSLTAGEGADVSRSSSRAFAQDVEFAEARHVSCFGL